MAIDDCRLSTKGNCQLRISNFQLKRKCCQVHLRCVQDFGQISTDTDGRSARSSFGNRHLEIGNQCVLMILGMSLISGCSLPRRSYDPGVAVGDLNDSAFLHYLASVPTVTVEEGARAALLVVGSTSHWPTFEEQWAELKRREAAREEWQLEPGDTLDKGTFAYMLMNVGNKRRGVNNHLAAITGLGDRRYALKACVDAGMLSAGLPHEAVSGGEMLSALRRMDQNRPL